MHGKLRSHLGEVWSWWDVAQGCGAVQVGRCGGVEERAGGVDVWTRGVEVLKCEVEVWVRGTLWPWSRGAVELRSCGAA